MAFMRVLPQFAARARHALRKFDLEGVVGERASIGERQAIAALSASVSSSDTPRNAASAAARRQGLCATPPIASRAELMRLPSTATAAAAETRANS